jgi:predicted naringenin-chalcone synthase
MPTTIADFHILRPDFELKQEDSVEWLAAIHTEASKDPSNHGTFLEKLRKISLGEQMVQKRGVSIADCFHRDWDSMEIYHASTKPSGACFGKRSEVFDRVATGMLTRFYPDGHDLPSHLLHVSCTGYVAPSPVQKLVSLRDSGHKTLITHVYHTGCYASIPALRIARGYAEPADIVHTEICSLHLNPSLHEMEQLVVQSLFADGFIKYSVKPTEEAGYRVLALDEQIISDSTDAMHWVCTDWGLKMKLAKEVPVLIARSLPSFVAKLLAQANVKNNSDIYFAIHPGGPRIIQQVGKILELRPEQFDHSLWVLQNYGNMSSATLPHVWEKLWHDIKDGSYIVSLAFGPGLTIAGGVFQCRR